MVRSTAIKHQIQPNENRRQSVYAYTYTYHPSAESTKTKRNYDASKLCTVYTIRMMKGRKQEKGGASTMHGIEEKCKPD
jgi:hypothetical protein